MLAALYELRTDIGAARRRRGEDIAGAWVLS
jgi:hypothetical protein